MNLDKRSAQIYPARWDWPSAIGTFLINFGMIEYLSSAYLKDNLELQEFAKLQQQPLKDRIERIQQHLYEVHRPSNKNADFDRLFKRFDSIRELRNHVAHGHFVFLMNEETQVCGISLGLPRDLDQESSPEARHVTFDELMASLSELTELIEALKEMVGFKPGFASE